MDQTFAILVMIDIIDSTKTTQQLGDLRMSMKMRLYDRIARGLLIKWNGLEIDRTDGYLLLFESMREALEYSTEYHKLIEKHTGFKSRVGIHAGVVVMHSNDSFFVSRGAKPIEVEGIQKSICARIMSLAGGGQTLLSSRAGQIAFSIRQRLKMADIGKWSFKGVKSPMQLYAISWDRSRLYVPRGNKKVKQVSRPKLTPKEIYKRRVRWFIIYPIHMFSFFIVFKLVSSLTIFYPFSRFTHYLNLMEEYSKWLYQYVP